MPIKFHVPLEENFREQWRWAARTGKWKGRWPRFKTLESMNTDLPSYVLTFSCFACACRGKLEYAQRDACGKICPIRWVKNQKFVTPCVCSLYSLFREYLSVGREITDRKRLAGLIAELPWREGGWG